MTDRWLNFGHKEELNLYTEPPCNIMDPWVTQKMVK